MPIWDALEAPTTGAIASAKTWKPDNEPLQNTFFQVRFSFVDLSYWIMIMTFAAPGAIWPAATYLEQAMQSLLVLSLAALLSNTPTTQACGASIMMAAAVINDDFADGDFVDNPAWTADAGECEVVAGELKIGPATDSAIHLDLGKVAWNTSLKVRLNLRQANASGGASYLFGFYSPTRTPEERMSSVPVPTRATSAVLVSTMVR